MAVLHKCDNPPCCRPKHLFLGTQVENNRDRHAKGRTRGPRGELAPSARLTAPEVIEMRRIYERGEANQFELARRYGVHQTTVSLIVTRKKWRHV